MEWFKKQFRKQQEEEVQQQQEEEVQQQQEEEVQQQQEEEVQQQQEEEQEQKPGCDLMSFLGDLGLEQHYSDKLSLSYVLQIDKSTVTDDPAATLSDISSIFLKKLMMVNVDARNTSCVPSTEESEEASSSDSDQNVNPLDIITALFLCADAFLQQEMASKMSMCQFSVPLLLPDCETGQCTLMLWALRDIVKRFRPHSLSDPKGFVEDRIILHDLPLVSFVRLGDCSSSKSNILNKLLSNSQQYHDIFVHHNMDCGDVPRKISNGLVEISWYLPGGNKKIDKLPEPLAVANLRGDIKNFETQYSFLCQVSTAVFVFSDELDLNCPQFNNQNVKARLFLVSNARTNDETLEKSASERNITIILKNKLNKADFMKSLLPHIQEVIKNSPQQRKKMDEVAVELGISVDENNETCQNAKKKAEVITKMIQDPLTFKQNELPLQGELWQQLSKLEKEECRLQKAGNKNLELYKSELREKRKKLREEQSNRLSPTMKHFIEALKDSGVERSYFLKWMQMNLDNLSRKQLSLLREKYKEKCRDSPENKEEISNLERQISKSSLGIEHFLREVGQLYEAAVFSPENSVSRELKAHLPRLGAQLLLDGFPLELVDGDASNIPLRWVSDVLKELNTLVNGKNKIRVVTVLGVQSTGKSTLLNTMFGVQFAVSTGRCTRGAFMLLTSISDSYRKELNCDYLMILDTEGLKSPELAKLDDSPAHDNELATLVVGLSDITIVNIAMENFTEMKDVLQIVVHAFLRMKEVGKKPKCVFVHQNVADVSSHDNNRRNRKLLLEQLNEMTEAAAKMENKEEYKTFNDVMKYDPESDNWYIPGLWHGNPPMAPVNSGYSENVHDFKKNILDYLVKYRNEIPATDILGLLEWTNSLWTAVKYENFIFSFRNSLVADAYMKLCKKYHEWEWSFKKHLFIWVTGAETRVSNFNMINPESDQSDLEDFLSKLKDEASSELDNQEQVILENLTKYFEQTEDHVCLVERFREEFMNSGRALRRETGNSVLNKLETVFEMKKVKNKLDMIKKKYTDKMKTQVKKLLEELRTNQSSQSMSDEELYKVFDNMWNKTVEGLSVKIQTKCDISDIIQKHLIKNVNQKGSVSAEKVKTITLDQYDKQKFTVNDNHLHKTLKNFIGNLKSKHKEELQGFADRVVNICIQSINDQKQLRSDFHETFIQEILNKTDEQLTSGKDLKFSEEFEASLKLHICGISEREFHRMHDDYINENDPRYCLNKFKDQYRAAFRDLFHNQDQCQRKAEEFTTFCLSPAVETFVYNSLGPDIIDSMLQGKTSFLFSTRAFSQFSILQQLLKENDFQNYVNYLASYEDFVKRWISNKITEKFSEGRKCFELEEQHLNKALREIKEAINRVQKSTSGNESIRNFIQNICRELGGTLVIPNDALEAIMSLNSANQKQFAPWLIPSLEEMEKQLKDKFEKRDFQQKLSKFKIQPQDVLFERLFGCGKQCPFCCAPCEAEGKAHEIHWASIHRPAGLGTVRLLESHKLSTDVCSSCVHSEVSFQCSETGNKFHPYKYYRQIFPDWLIPADPSIGASDYWKYVMVKFNDQFAKRFDAKPADIPQAWKYISQEQAEQSLKESFSIGAPTASVMWTLK